MFRTPPPSAVMRWAPTVMAAVFLATAAGVAAAQGDAEDAADACREHLLSDPEVFDVDFYTTHAAQDMATWKTTSAGGRKLINAARFYVMSSSPGEPENGTWTDLCVHAEEVTSFYDLPPEGKRDRWDRWDGGGWVMMETRGHAPVGVVQVNASCWAQRTKIADCNPTFKPMGFFKNLPLFKHSPLEEAFWTNMSIHGLAVNPTWIWKLHIQTLQQGSITTENLSQLDIRSLEELEMHGNDWRRPTNFLRPLPLLKKLDLTNNSLEIIPDETLIYSPNIQKLILARNNITTYPSEVKYLRQLYQFDLSDSRALAPLRITNDDIENLPSTVRAVLLANTKLQTNASNMVLKSGLNYLNLSGCAISRLQDVDDGYATNITLLSLDLSDNELESIPPNIFRKMPRLNILYLSNNKLQSWDQELLEENALEWLGLSNNQITDLTNASFVNLKRLTYINLSKNGIQYIPFDVFKNLKNLLTVILSHNKLATIPQAIFSYNTKLEFINLSHNRIEKHLNLKDLSLNEIDLSHNILKSVDASNSNIDELNLSFNDIENLTIPNTKKLNISYNSLSHISPQMWVNIMRLRQVDLGGNDFDCCRFGSEPYYKEKYITKILILGSARLLYLTCTINKGSTEYVLDSFSYETLCNPKTKETKEKTILSLPVKIFLPLFLSVLIVIVVGVLLYVFRSKLPFVGRRLRRESDIGEMRITT